MRYADQPTTHREVRVAADPARVWKIVADVEAMTRWSPELERVEWCDGATGPAVGVRYAGHNRHPLNGEWRTVSEITEYVPGRTLTWCVLDVDGRFGKASEGPADRMAAWSFALSPAPEGGTVLRQSVTIGPGRSGLSAFIERTPEREEAIVAYRLDELGKGMEATLAGIKQAAEDTAAR
ncbi:SRPBCC family protein [Streptomyces sennicomposti]|uniref:SRPBCC family protein n=1 Tax=Streptomyces sennicomposti TaxID=2873384 RepID=UPI001CA71D6B|nr:SRPBCC family protein [Streptomyces sennicomposti]MBY8869362.1 SRPBCC family protein [Streptomyces sennicomposti]